MPGDFKTQKEISPPQASPSPQALFFTLNGQKTQGYFGQTLLEAIKPHNKIPTLCGESIPGLGGPCSGCGLSVVEIKDRDELVQACSTLLEEGQEVMTFSRSVRRSRILALRELAKRHTANCLFCERSGACSLQKICADQGLALLSQPRPNPEFTLLAAKTPTGELGQTSSKPEANSPMTDSPEALSLRSELALVGQLERPAVAPNPFRRTGL